MIKNYYKISSISGELIAEKMSADEAAKMLGVVRRTVVACEEEHRPLKNEYVIEKLDIPVEKRSNNYPADLRQEYDEICKRLRRYDLSNVRLTVMEKTENGKDACTAVIHR